MTTARLFRNGRSQAVRLPKEFRFEGEEVEIRRQGRNVILAPVPRREWPRGYWTRWGKATQGLRPVAALPAGSSAIELDEE